MESQHQAGNCSSIHDSPAAHVNTSEIALHGTSLATRHQLEEPAISRGLSKESDDPAEELDGTISPVSLTESMTTSTYKPSKPLTKISMLYCSPTQDEKLRSPRLYGWRETVLTCSITSASILTINIILLIWAVSKFGHTNGESILYTGDCRKAQTLSTLLHVLINVLSTLLLSASNYTMQCLHSPTRAEVDRAHAQKKWVEIGVPSWRNRRFVSLKNKILCYNSSVFLETDAQEYQAEFTTSTVVQLIQDNTIPNNTTCVNLTWQQCKSIYQGFVHDYGDVICVTPGDANPKLVAAELYNETPLTLDQMSLVSWTIPDVNNPQYGQLSMSSGSYNVTSCCAKPTMKTPCRLTFDIVIMSVVIICNATKSLCMFFVILKAKDYQLVTLGDAIASFLETPDLTTKNQCLISKRDVLNGEFKREPRDLKRWKCGSERFTDTQFYAVSARCWAWVNFCFLASLIVLFIASIILRGSGQVYKTLRPDYPETITRNIAGWAKTGTLLLVNLPQTIVSLMIVLYNSCLTSICLMKTWNSFSKQPETLRVTTPLGKQKSQYYLTIPYKYAIPLLLTTSSFHWSISNSFFLVSIKAFKNTEEQPQDSVYAIGYSSLSILISAIICFVLFAVLTWKALRKCAVQMPVAGGCSVVISAACHKRDGDEAPQLDNVMWGVLTKQDTQNWGHCGFGSEVVERPVPGLYYS